MKTSPHGGGIRRPARGKASGLAAFLLLIPAHAALASFLVPRPALSSPAVSRPADEADPPASVAGPPPVQEAVDRRQESPPVPPGKREWSSGGVRIIARNHERTEDRVFASGAVEIHTPLVTLMAESVAYDPETKDVLAEGNVVVLYADEVLQAESVLFNLDTQIGRIEKASGMIRPSILFEAESAEKKAPDLFSLRKARVTACTQPRPRWGFSFSRAEIRKDESIEMWDAVLRVKNIPVFYLPYMRYPLEKERATGFLTPKIGFSGPKGFHLSQSYYWAIARNLDATVGVDVYPRFGLGAGLEFRYLFPAGTNGEASLYYFLARKRASGTGLSNSSVIRINHSQALPAGFKLVADVNYQTSFDFLREFDDDFRRAVISNRSSQVYLTRSWARFNLSARASRYETYYSERDDAVVSTYLPQISFNVFKVKILPPLYFSLASAFNSWQYGWSSEYEAGTERKSRSLALSPTLSLPLTSIPWATANTSVTANFVYHGQSLLPETGQVVDDPFATLNYALKVDVTGPVFYRVYFGAEGEPRLKHIIEPTASYSYDSPISGAERIVTPYGYFRAHQLSYGLTNRFLVRRDGRSLEILSVGVNQTFYLSPEDGPLSRYPVDGRPPRFSEIQGSLRYYPSERFSLDAAAGYNPYYKELSSWRMSANLGSKTEKPFLSLSWFRSRNSWITGIDPGLLELYNRHQISLFGGCRIPGLSLEIMGDVDFNVNERRLLYTGAQAVYHYQCLDFTFEVKVFYYRGRPETQFRFSLGLGNIGKTAGFLSGFGF